MPVLGLIAGSGPLPFEVVAAAAARGLEVAIAAIEDNTDPAIGGLDVHALRWLNAGQLGALIGFFHEVGADEVILAGAISKRRILQNPAALRPDARAQALLLKLAGSGERGDDTLLRAIAGELESDGLRVVASTRYLDERMTPEGLLAGPELSAALHADVALGLRVIEALGPHDVGQAVVVREGVVLAVEAVEGTDAALRRGAGFGKGAVLVKAAKPGQDMRFDVPVIGAGTLELAAAGGLGAIALEADRTLILEREQALAAAQSAGISVIGVRRAGAP